MEVSKLAFLVGQIESGNNPHASLTDYAGNVSYNAQYQQGPAYIKQYGAGAAGIDNQAHQLLQRSPHATLSDFYSEYNHGSVLPWRIYCERFPLQANNFIRNVHALGYTPDTLVATLV
jgi:hypothetical protein